MHIDNIDFPNFSRNAANFPNSKGPGPIPKKGCESPGMGYLRWAPLSWNENILPAPAGNRTQGAAGSTGKHSTTSL